MKQCKQKIMQAIINMREKKYGLRMPVVQKTIVGILVPHCWLNR